MKSILLFTIGVCIGAVITVALIVWNVKNYNSTGIYFSDDVCAEVIEMNEGVN